jgi:hypothetical protein
MQSKECLLLHNVASRVAVPYEAVLDENEATVGQQASSHAPGIS